MNHYYFSPWIVECSCFAPRRQGVAEKGGIVQIRMTKSGWGRSREEFILKLSISNLQQENMFFVFIN